MQTALLGSLLSIITKPGVTAGSVTYTGPPAEAAAVSNPQMLLEP